MTTGLTVVKCGGSDAIDADRVCADIAALRGTGERVLLVHGGAADIGRLADQLGVARRALRSPAGVTSRHTDPDMLDVVLLALAGRVKPRLLAALARAGVPAVGLTGLDGGLLRATRKAARRAVTPDGRIRLVRDDHSGRIGSVDATVPRLLLNGGLTPVLSPPATGPAGTPLNVDADRVAAAVAAALDADRLILLTAAAGLLADPADPTSVLSHHALPPTGPTSGSARLASAGMFRKLVAAREALLGGVPEVRIADGRTAAPLTAALHGAGTRVSLNTPVPTPVSPGLVRIEGAR
jgi:acetylglutamate/LysW-gamma-L-alpha-aminoadipate kinase